MWIWKENRWDSSTWSFHNWQGSSVTRSKLCNATWVSQRIGSLKPLRSMKSSRNRRRGSIRWKSWMSFPTSACAGLARSKGTSLTNRTWHRISCRDRKFDWHHHGRSLVRKSLNSLSSEVCISRLYQTTRGDQLKIWHTWRTAEGRFIFYKDL